MVSAASLGMMEAEQQVTQPQLVQVVKSPPPPPVVAPVAAAAQPQQEETPDATMEVPDQILVNKKEKRSSKHRKRFSKEKGKDKEGKVHKRKSSSSKHDRKRRSSKDKDGKERKRRKSRRSKSSDPDPNDPVTLAKSRELLLAAMGVKKRPDQPTCFVSSTLSLENNPIYQRNKHRMSSTLATSQSESHLSAATAHSSFATMETARSMDDIAGFHQSMNRMEQMTGTIPEGDEDNSEYDQFIEF